MDSAEFIDLQQRLGNCTHVQAVTATINSLDPDQIEKAYRGTGSDPYPPLNMLAIALFEILNKSSSPAQWHKDAGTRDQCKLLGQGITPSRSVWYTFRDRAAKFIHDVHQQIVRQAIGQGLVDATQCALDGTFTRAAASRHQLFNLKQISKRIAAIKKAIKHLASPAPASVDIVVARWIARTPQGRQQQLARYRRAKRRLLDQVGENRQKTKKYQRDENKILISPADIDAVIGRDKEKIVGPIYNTQSMVACHSGVIVEYGVFAVKHDAITLVPMIEQTQRTLAERYQPLSVVHADSGYCSLLGLGDCRRLRIDLLAPVQDHSGSNGSKSAAGEALYSQKDFVFSHDGKRAQCPAGHTMPKRTRQTRPRADGRSVVEIRHQQTAQQCGACPLSANCLKPGVSTRTVVRMEGQDVLDAQERKMASVQGHRSQRLRSQTVELVFGDGKRHRNQNQQNGRGLDSVKAEVGLLVVAQNSLRLHNLRKRKQKTLL